MKRQILTLVGVCFVFIMYAQEERSTAVTLRVDDATMTVDPARGGKILSLKYQEQEVLSQSRFPESFGSTFWTSPQKEWNWPPVAEFDKQPYEVVQCADGRLTISSPVSERLGMSVWARISPSMPRTTLSLSLIPSGTKAQRLVA